ncbi:MAG TPA: BT_3928 family protein [Flavobacterium sp.]|nr:BT_3928 family protein [Flavobacterium sp.]
MMKVITQFARFVVGVLFIISGLIKLNDPLGFSFKLDEYFAEDVFNMPFLQPLALWFALFVVIVEVLLGVMLLIGYKRKFTLWALFAMIVFFTFLTFYSAYFNKVTDCGCFGDAIPLTPWQSFYKDIALLVLILILLAGRKYINPIFRAGKGAVVVLISLILCAGFGYYVLNHLPVVDFRPYKIGADIEKGMEFPEGAPKDVFDIQFIYDVGGEEVAFSMENLGDIPEGADLIERKETLISKGYEPPIHDFSIEKFGDDYTEDYLNEPKVILVIAYDLNKTDIEGFQQMVELEQKAYDKGYEIIGLTSSSDDIIEEVKNQSQVGFEFYFCDATTLKTIVRANPGVVVMEYGVIKDKKHWNDVDKLKF